MATTSAPMTVETTARNTSEPVVSSGVPDQPRQTNATRTKFAILQTSTVQYTPDTLSSVDTEDFYGTKTGKKILFWNLLLKFLIGNVLAEEIYRNSESFCKILEYSSNFSVEQANTPPPPHLPPKKQKQKQKTGRKYTCAYTDCLPVLLHVANNRENALL